MDVQRDLAHARAREALAEVEATGTPVWAILVTHDHPDPHVGFGVPKEAFPQALTWSSKTISETIRTDPHGFGKLVQELARQARTRAGGARNAAMTGNPFSLDGQAVLVVGASSAIGAATAGLASVLGARVLLASRSRAKLDAVRAGLARPDGAETRVLDYLDPASVAEALAPFGRVDHLSVA